MSHPVLIIYSQQDAYSVPGRVEIYHGNKANSTGYLVLTTVTEGPIAPIPTRLVFMAESPSGHAPSPPFRNAAQTANQRLRKPKRKRQARTSTAASDSLERQMGSARSEVPRGSPASLLCCFDWQRTNTQHSPTVPPFFLPNIVREQCDKRCHSKSDDGYLDHIKEIHDLSVYNLAWAIQHGVGGKCIERYLSQHHESEIAE